MTAMMQPVVVDSPLRVVDADPSIEDWIPFAKKVTAKYLGISTREAEYQEEYSDALVGLWHATQKYNPSLGYKFVTYAASCIRRQIRDGRKVRSNQNKLNPVTLDNSGDNYVRHIGEKELLSEIASPANISELLSDCNGDSKMEKFYKLVLRKHYLEGVSVKNIAEELKVTRQYIHQSVKDGLKMLRQRISA